MLTPDADLQGAAGVQPADARAALHRLSQMHETRLYRGVGEDVDAMGGAVRLERLPPYTGMAAPLSLSSPGPQRKTIISANISGATHPGRSPSCYPAAEWQLSLVGSYWHGYPVHHSLLRRTA